VIGTGASAIQFVPEIAPLVEKLQVFQRTAPWIAPKVDRAMRPFEKRLFRWLSPTLWFRRARLYWMAELMAVGFVVNPKLLKLLEGLLRRSLAAQVRDRELRRKLTPSYSLGCKRILISNDWSPALQRPNVELVTAPIERITPKGIQTQDGVEHAADAIICGTGFMVGDYLTRLRVVGRAGRTLDQVVSQRIGTYLGITVHGFPNLFLLMGPNTGLGHNSMIFDRGAGAARAAGHPRSAPEARLPRCASPHGRASPEAAEGSCAAVWSSAARAGTWTGMATTARSGRAFVQYWWRTRRRALSD
jgi:cation diffusion facilitator CzcD-associated flavoprotein CzcO